jgi:hypothetical protein
MKCWVLLHSFVQTNSYWDFFCKLEQQDIIACFMLLTNDSLIKKFNYKHIKYARNYELNLSQILYSFYKFKNFSIYKFESFSILFTLYLNLELRNSLFQIMKE